MKDSSTKNDKDKAFRVILKALSLSFLVLLSFILLEEVTSELLESVIPAKTTIPDLLLSGLVMLFYLTSWLQIALAMPIVKNKLVAMQVHARNGFYLDSIVNRIAGLF